MFRNIYIFLSEKLAVIDASSSAKNIPTFFNTKKVSQHSFLYKYKSSFNDAILFSFNQNCRKAENFPYCRSELHARGLRLP